MAIAELWWDSDEPQKAVLEMGRKLWESQGKQRISLAEASLALYTGSSRHSITGGMRPLGLLDLLDGADTSAENIIMEVVDTKVSQVLRNKVRPLFVTEGGDSELKARIAAKQTAVDGLMYELGMRGALAVQAAYAGYLFEAGGIEWFADVANSRVVGTPVSCWEYFVPKREARYGNPRQLFARHAIDRAVLLSYLSKAPKTVREAVENADPATYAETADDSHDPKSLSDQVIIYKAWHLPSGRVDMKDPRSFGRSESDRAAKPNHDGRHVVAIDGGKSSGETVALVNTPWPYDHFPVSWFKPFYVPGSWWSRGIPEILASNQIELNRWNQREKTILDLHARPSVVLSKGSKLNPAMITNGPANIYQVEGPAGAAMTVLNMPAVPTDLLGRCARIAQAAKDQLGMSDLSMKAQKPAGINHEPGMAYLQDTESIRHTTENDNWTEFNIDSAKNIDRCLGELARHDPNFELIFEGDNELKRQKWTEVSDESDVYRVKAWGTNLFKQDPAQRADQIADFVERGLLPPEAMIDAVDAPDWKALVGNRAAMRNNIEKMLDRVVKDGFGEQEAPNPYMDLQASKQLGIQRMNELQATGDQWKQINEVMKWLEAVDDLLKINNPAPAAPNQGEALGSQGPMLAPGQPPPAPMPGGPPPMAA